MPLTHTERWQLAKRIIRDVVGHHGDEILLGGVYGSAARGTDTPWSDLELIFVVADGSTLRQAHHLYRGTAVGYAVHRMSELEAALAGVSPDWPFLMGVLNVLRVLHGDPALVTRWLAMGATAPAECFRATLLEQLPGLVFESYGRILSCQLRGNRRDIWIAVVEVLLEMNRALCLLNRRWVTHDYYQGFQDTLAFPKLPQGYAELVDRLWEAREFDEILSPAKALFAAFLQLLDAEGIRLPDYGAPAL